MTYTRAELQSAMVRALCSEPAGFVLHDERGGWWFQTVRELGDRRVEQGDFLQMTWSLVRQGLVYFHPYSDKLSELHMLPTDAGRAAADDQESNPDNSSEYVQRLRSTVPEADAVVMLYAEEALTSYLNCSYLACAVMLGVASEAAFLELANSFSAWLPANQGMKLRQTLDGKRAGFNQKFLEFRNALSPQRPALAKHSPDLADGLALTLDGIIELLRIYRNDAGHPTGKRYNRSTMFVHLQMFAILLRKMYDLKRVFDQRLATPLLTSGTPT